MSTGSPRRTRAEARSIHGCTVVSPQPVTDASLLDSVAGFISEVATYNVPDNKDQIQWVKFEHLDNQAFLQSGDKTLPNSLLLILGYTNGMQIWAIQPNGEAIDILSWRHGTVRVLRILPTPYKVGCDPASDLYAEKRPLMALCDGSAPGPPQYTVTFLSLKTGEQVKVIKFKNPILDVVSNRRSIVVTFAEKFAVFDAFTLETKLQITTCYLSPGVNPNPIALGPRWLAYAEKKLISHKRSNGGNCGEGVQSYTATVLQAAKSLGKGLRGLGETVASSLTGNSSGSSQLLGVSSSEVLEKGMVTILDVEGNLKDDDDVHQNMVVHFPAHSEAVAALEFDQSGLLLLSADKNGHDFHLFRIQPHPGGSTLASVHHLYILHRGDTTARVQNMCFTPDSRWVAVSTMRGTTHVFPVTPYGGNINNRTHMSSHVVNKMSRFHRSAGLPQEGKSNNPNSSHDSSPILNNKPYPNPRLPPFPQPALINPLAQIRQPIYVASSSTSQQRSHLGRQRHNSSDDGSQAAVRLCVCFAPGRAYFDNLTQPQEILSKPKEPIEPLFIMSCHGTLIQYNLNVTAISSVPKDKVSDETPIELTVRAKAQWDLQRQVYFNDVPLPISTQNLKLLPHENLYKTTPKPSHDDEEWLSQVEIITHTGPHRRLWMGPQFTFKTYKPEEGVPLSIVCDSIQTIDVNRSGPVNVPVGKFQNSIIIESGSCESFRSRHFSEGDGEFVDSQLKQDLADAMLESPQENMHQSGGRCVVVAMKSHSSGIAKVVNPLGTVVTVHASGVTETQVSEDTILHENCDEALFRPMVAPKTVMFTENKLPNHVVPVISEKVDNGKRPLHKNLPNLTCETSEKKVKNTPVVEKKGSSCANQVSSKLTGTCLINDNFDDKRESNSYKFEHASSSVGSDENDKEKCFGIDFPKFSYPSLNFEPCKIREEIPIDDFGSIDLQLDQSSFNVMPVMKEEKFEDAQDIVIMDDEPLLACSSSVSKTYVKTKGPLESSDSNEEAKVTTKKPRKPKAKLGIRLSSKQKEIIEKIEIEPPTVADCDIVIIPEPKKASWSNIVSNLKPKHDYESDLDENEKLSILESKVAVSRMSYSNAMKNKKTDADLGDELTIDSIDDTCNEILKVDTLKLSDDEKPLENGASSQNETTESDDSITKIISMDTEEDNCQQLKNKDAQQQIEKSVKRKSRKKKR